MTKKRIIKNFTIDTPEKYWAVLFGYHVHKGIIGVLLSILGIFFIYSNHFLTSIILILAGIGIVAIDTIGHIHTNWHKTFTIIEKHNGSKYKKGGYKNKEVKNLGY